MCVKRKNNIRLYFFIIHNVFSRDRTHITQKHTGNKYFTIELEENE